MSSTRATLNLGTKRNIQKLVDKIFEVKSQFIDSPKGKVDDIVVRTDDGVLYEASVFLDASIPNYGEMTDISGSYDFFDIEVVINPNLIKSKKQLYNKLYHEFLHATDPTLTTQQDPESIQNILNMDTDEKYYGSAIEFRAWTGEILEALQNEIISRLHNDTTEQDIIDLKDILKNIVVHITTGRELQPRAKKLLDAMEGNNDGLDDLTDVLEKVKINHPQLMFLFDKDEQGYTHAEYLAVLKDIRTHNKEQWGDFILQLKQLYNELISILDGFDFD